VTLLLAFAVGLSIFLIKPEHDDSSSSSHSNSSSDEVEITPISVITGFEEDESIEVIECGNGMTKQLNSDKKFVLSGEKSLKLSISQFATAEFSFADHIIERDIRDYEYVSFWIYADYDGVVALGNTAEWTSSNGVYVNSAITGKTWTKIKIAKGSSLFNVIKYNLSFNWFNISAVGKDAGKVIEYDVYIDDVRLYKSGMNGECEMLLANGGGYTTAFDAKIAGEAFTLPEICAFSPEGYRIYQADNDMTKQVLDGEGNVVESIDGVYVINKAGTYNLVATYDYQGIQNKIAIPFDVEFVHTSAVYGGVYKVGESIELPSIDVFKPGTEEIKNDVTLTSKVIAPDGSDIAINNNTFTAQVQGKYNVTYTIRGQVNGVENSYEVSTPFWVNGVSGLIADFANDEIDMFATDSMTAKITLVSSVGEVYKESKDYNRASLKAILKDNRAAQILIADNFPIKNMNGAKYLSMWVYNGTSANLTMEISNSSEKAVVESGLWNFVVFTASSFIGDFRNQTIMLYDSKGSALNGNLYFDNLRIIKEGDPEELVFASNATIETFNPETKEGIRYAQNAKYEVDLSLFTVGGAVVSDVTAEVIKIVDKRNKSVEITDGKYFIPTEIGKHTISLRIEKDGIINTIEKVIDVGAQILISPDDKFLLIPGEVGVSYSLNVIPEIWNKGVIDTINEDDPNGLHLSVFVYNAVGEEITLTNNSFTPTVAGKYTIYYIATQNNGNKQPANADLKTSLSVYEAGKYGVVADFEDGNAAAVEACRYYYGDVSSFEISNQKVHSGNSSAVVHNLSDETQSIIFNLAENNIAGDISNSTSFSFWIYIEDLNGDNTYYLGKNAYAEWVNERDPQYVVGSLAVAIVANQWYEIKIERADYETVLGGTIFAGATISLGGAMWTAADNDFITQFYVYNFERINKSVNIYVDDFVVEYSK